MRKSIRLVVIIVALFMTYLFQGQAHSEETDMVILVDRSGSMKKSGGDPQGLSRAAVEFLLDQLELASDDNRCALVLFNSSIRTIPDGGLTSDFQHLRSGLNAIAEIGGNTDLEEALNVGLRFLAKSEARKQIVLISDGKPEPDITSNRAAERFPEQFARWRNASSIAQRDTILQQLSELSTQRIQDLFLDVLKENRIELYPIALTGIHAHGEALLQAMAINVTHNANAFKKVQARDLITGLDTIVPKPASLMNICRSELERAGENQWSVDFELDSSLHKVRVLMLYSRPPDDLSWSLTGPSGTISPDNQDTARCSTGRDQNGKGNAIFERIFLDNPLNGRYTLKLMAPRFIPPMQVIIEGRTDLRLAVTAEPLPAEVGLPVKIHCRLDGGVDGGLKSAQGHILDAKGESVDHGLSFSTTSSQALSATWVPSTQGNYLINIKGYLDSENKRYVNARYSLLVEPKQAVKLHIQIPVRK